MGLVNCRVLTHLDDIILLLEDSACQGTLVAVIQSVGVCAVLDEETNEACVTVIGGKHELQSQDRAPRGSGLANRREMGDGELSQKLR